MDKQKTIFLFLCLILIAIFGFDLFLDTDEATSAPSSGVEKSNVYISDDRNAPVSSSDNDSNYQELLDRGFSAKQAKRLILQELQDVHSTTELQDIYWKTTEASKVALVGQKHASQQKIRDALKARFGQSARDEPIFREVFLPLQKQFPFLTSHEQIALQQLQIDHQISMMSTPQARTHFSPSRGNPKQLASLLPTTLSLDVSLILSKESAFEYNLRMSTLAHQLRKSDVDFSEETFRKAYQILENLFSVTPSNTVSGRQQLPDSTLVDRRVDLDELLGSENTLKIMVALDPEFQELKRRATAINLNEEQLMMAYEISLEARKAIFEGVRVKESNPEIGVEMIRDAANNHWNQISQQLGDEVAEKLLSPKNHLTTSQQPRVFTSPNTINN